MKRDLDTDKIFGDARVLCFLHKYIMFTLFPIKTSVQNTGHDRSGVNAAISNEYINNIPDENFLPSKYPKEITIDKTIYKTIRRKKKVPKVVMIKIWIKKVLTTVSVALNRALSNED